MHSSIINTCDMHEKILVYTEIISGIFNIVFFFNACAKRKIIQTLQYLAIALSKTVFKVKSPKNSCGCLVCHFN